MVFVVQYHWRKTIFRHNNGTKGIRIQGPPGAYNITDFNLPIKRLMKWNGDDKDSINIQHNYNILKSRIIFAHIYQNNFTIKIEFRYLLAFDTKRLGEDGVLRQQHTSQHYRHSLGNVTMLSLIL